MLFKFRKASDVRSSEITPKSVFENRRHVLKAMGFAGAGAAACLLPSAGAPAQAAGGIAAPGVNKALKATVNPKYTLASLNEEATPYSLASTYNNFYEFGTRKDQPAQNAHTLRTSPWNVMVDGACGKPGVYAYEDLIRQEDMEERVYRFRCVEAWSMVIPWVGVPLHKILSRLEPAAQAKYVYFETLDDPEQMPGLRSSVLKWPYREGLRMDEAMNGLTLMTVGMYGEVIPNQNGAPMRLIVPWKYGFKSIKSIVRIRFQEQQPETSWNLSAPNEYGFYSNVNPAVDHPRWSQGSEKRLGQNNIFGLPVRIKTLPFNGYAEEVADLYKGMDLSKLR